MMNGFQIVTSGFRLYLFITSSISFLVGSVAPCDAFGEAE